MSEEAKTGEKPAAIEQNSVETASDDPREAVRARFLCAEDVTPDNEPGPTGDEEPDGAPLPDNPDEGFPAEVRAQAAAFPLNDIGNVGRMVTYFGEDMLFVPRVGWFIWTGAVWQKDTDVLEVRRRAHLLSDLIDAEVPHVALEEWQRELLAGLPVMDRRIATIEAVEEADRDEDMRDELSRLKDRHALALRQKSALPAKRKAHREFAKGTGNANRIEKAYLLAQVKLAAPLETLDSDPLAVNVGNGTLRFKVEKGEDFGATARVTFEPHTREARQTKLVQARYDPHASAPRFDAFLARIQPDPVMRAFLQRWFGLSMTALTGEQKLAFLFGHGANGKSVLVDLIAKLLADYAATAKIESLTGRSKRSGADATPDLIPLVGARLVRASEPEEGERLKENTIKELTGGEPILVRALHGDFFEFHPQFKLTISGNYKPDIRGTDDGIWRRVLLVPFDVQIPARERDPDLGRKLFEEEADGILKWMVDGLIDYLEGGLQEPPLVLEATANYRADSDPVGTFLTECTIIDGGEDFMVSRDLITAFNVWNFDREGMEWGGRTVSNALAKKAGRWRHPASGSSFVAHRRESTGYLGVRLTPDFRRKILEAGKNLSDSPRSVEEAPL